MICLSVTVCGEPASIDWAIHRLFELLGQPKVEDFSKPSLRTMILSGLRSR